MPSRLKEGDCVGIVAPAGPVNREELEKGLRVIRRMGFRPVLGEHVFSRERFLAGADEDRAHDLMAMFEDKAVKAIFCARGGYGVNRVLPLLDPRIIRKNPKILVGASDITLLLLYIHQKCSSIAFHGPMVSGNFGRYPMRKTKSQFQQILSADAKGKKLFWPKARVLQPGTARGIITGGCLSLLCRSLGTPYEIQSKDRILVIEDVNEPPYKIDGMLQQLKSAGKFKAVRAVVFGEMVGCRLPGQTSKYMDHLIQDVFSEESFPLVTGFPLGHGREMWTLPIGTEATVSTRSKSIQFKNCGVL